MTVATITVSATAKASFWEKPSEECDFSALLRGLKTGSIGHTLRLLVFQRPCGYWLFSLLLSYLECLWKMSLVLKFNGNTQWMLHFLWKHFILSKILSYMLVNNRHHLQRYYYMLTSGYLAMYFFLYHLRILVLDLWRQCYLNAKIPIHWSKRHFMMIWNY